MLKRLRTVDKRFQVWVDRGKGSHRMVTLLALKDRRYLRDIIRYFDFPDDIFD